MSIVQNKKASHDYFIEERIEADFAIFNNPDFAALFPREKATRAIIGGDDSNRAVETIGDQRPLKACRVRDVRRTWGERGSWC